MITGEQLRSLFPIPEVNIEYENEKDIKKQN